MQLTVRIYLQPEAEFQIDAQPSDTIGKLKANIGVTRGYDAEKLSIIFRGQGLDNDKTLESCKISEKGFIVMSISRPPPELPIPKELDVSEYLELTEEEVSEYLGTGSLNAALQPRTTSASEGETATESDPANTSASTPKFRPLTPTAFDAELTSDPMPPFSTVSTFKYKPMTSSAKSSNVPMINASTFKHQDAGDRSGSFPLISTEPTFKYKPMPPSVATSEGTPSAAQSTTNASTFKYKPMFPLAFDTEMTSGPLPLHSNVSTFKYRPLSSSETTTEGSSSSVPPASNVSTFKYRPLSSTAPLAEGSPSSVLPTTNLSTFRYRPPSSSPSVGESTSGPVPASKSTSSQSTSKYVPVSSSGRTLGSTSTHVPGSVPSAVRPPYLSQGGSAFGSGSPRTLSSGLGNSTGLPSGADIAQFRELITQSPEFRQHLIQRLSQENPELGQSLTQNPDLLLQFLEGMGRDGNGGVGAGADPGLGSGSRVVRLSVTPAEQAAIERLEGFGFPKQAVIEAYFACDKNEELAVNYLLENA